MYLNEKSKELISKTIGIPIDNLKNMSEDEIKETVEQKIGKKLKWKTDTQIDGLPICTMEDIDKKIDNLKSYDER